MTLNALKGLLAATAVAALASPAAYAQPKVANYAFGKPGTASYEHLSFWVKGGKPTDIYYAFGPDRKEYKLAYAGQELVNGKPAFKVQFSNKHMLYLQPSGTGLKVASTKTDTPKTYAWEYEGPTNGIGTFCQPCAADEKEAMRLLQAAYVR
ncbi:MAG TPA: hypothetical protein VF629_05545 [Hymenobacter sp.]|jgi:hypothetical protein|uniref:hypothetical protein n=1 Tax=Hymenobacter sp. TaxID=1898978 RepID=UPI002ED9CBEE